MRNANELFPRDVFTGVDLLGLSPLLLIPLPTLLAPASRELQLGLVLASIGLLGLWILARVITALRSS
jgi:hypothetical protein